MGKKKLQHFAEMKTFDCVFEPDKTEMISGNFRLKGNWNREYFLNDNPIVLELGCGKGEYSVELAKKYPDKNFIGVDVKGARLWKGSKTVDSEGLKNVAFVRTKIEFINTFFDKGEVSEIWLTFSDPQPKDKKGTKRITSHLFMAKYAQILSYPKLVNIKTDSKVLYRKTLDSLNNVLHEILVNSSDIYGKDWSSFDDELQEILSIKTFYELKFLEKGDAIHYLKILLKDEDQ